MPYIWEREVDSTVKIQNLNWERMVDLRMGIGWGISGVEQSKWPQTSKPKILRLGGFGTKKVQDQAHLWGHEGMGQFSPSPLPMRNSLGW